MPDREKVIKETKDGIAFAESRGFGGLANTMRDALAMIKEQEAVAPITQSSVYDPDTWFYVCGSCKKSVIDRGDKFCRWCGKAAKRE